MDPLSITVSVLALLQLTEKVISYAKQTRDAPKERTRILQEASGLVGLLITLKGLINDCDPRDPWLLATFNLATPDGPLDQYKFTLETLIKSIMPNDGLRKVSQVVTWKFSKEEVVGLLSQIERVKSLINIALGMDDMLVFESYLCYFLCMLIAIGHYHVRSRRICKQFKRALLI
jgi:hypothetical protein